MTGHIDTNDDTETVELEIEPVEQTETVELELDVEDSSDG